MPWKTKVGDTQMLDIVKRTERSSNRGQPI